VKESLPITQQKETGASTVDKLAQFARIQDTYHSDSDSRPSLDAAAKLLTGLSVAVNAMLQVCLSTRFIIHHDHADQDRTA
jgi:hypothetical protein